MGLVLNLCWWLTRKRRTLMGKIMIKLASCLTLADGWPQSLEVKTSKHRWHWCLPSALATIIYIYCMWIHLTFGSPVTSWLTLGACRRVTDAWQGRRISRGFSAVPTWYCRQSKRLGTSGGKEYSSKSPKTALIRGLGNISPVKGPRNRLENKRIGRYGKYHLEGWISVGFRLLQPCCRQCSKGSKWWLHFESLHMYIYIYT